MHENISPTYIIMRPWVGGGGGGGGGPVMCASRRGGGGGGVEYHKLYGFL